MGRVVHFEIHASDPERAAAFYREVFGWEVQELVIPGAEEAPESRYWGVLTGPEGEPGINGGLLPRPGAAPTPGESVNAFVCTISVDSLKATIEKALASGGSLALPKMPVPGVGWLAYCFDTEGNIVGMMQEDPNAG